MTSNEAAKKVAAELGRPVNSKGTEKLAVDLERTEVNVHKGSKHYGPVTPGKPGPQAKHTEGEATVDSTYPHGILVIIGKHVLCEIDGDCPRAEQEANAAHFALCWNSHEDLVAACKEIVDYYQNMSGNPNCPIPDKYWLSGAIKARDVLLKATKGGGAL